MQTRATLAALLALSAAPAVLAAEPARTNVLFIAADDLNIDLGCLRPSAGQVAERRSAGRMRRHLQAGLLPVSAVQPEPVVDHDRLAARLDPRLREQTHFRKPARTSSPWPSSSAVPATSWPASARSIHYGCPARSAPAGWTIRRRGRSSSTPSAGTRTTKTCSQLDPPQGLRPARSLLSPPTGTDAEQTDGKVAEEAIKLLGQSKQDASRSSWPSASIGPTCPWFAPKKYFDMYALDKIKMPVEPADIRQGAEARLHRQSAQLRPEGRRSRQCIRGLLRSTSVRGRPDRQDPRRPGTAEPGG